MKLTSRATGALMLAFVGLAFGTGFAVAEQTERAWQMKVSGAALNGGNGSDTKLSNAYQEAAGNRALTHAAVELAFSWEENARPKETSWVALQVMQNQKLIKQNAEIIALLKKKK